MTTAAPSDAGLLRGWRHQRQRMRDRLRDIMPTVKGDTGWQTFGMRRTYILPTRGGIFYLMTIGILILCGINYENNLVYALAFLMTGLFLICVLHTHQNMFRLATSIGPDPAAVFAGETLILRVSVNNPGQHLSGLIASARYTDKTGEEPRWATSAMCHLPTKTSRIINIPIATRHRGVVSINRIRLHSEYPLGLLRAWGVLSVTRQCVVYPTPTGWAPPPTEESASDDDEGDNTRTGAGDFYGLKPYQPGSSMHRIAWKQSQINDELYVKQFAGYANQTKIYTWAHVSGLRDTEARLSQLCKWILEAHASGAEYGLHLPTARIPSGCGAEQQRYCLSALARFPTDKDDGL